MNDDINPKIKISEEFSSAWEEVTKKMQEYDERLDKKIVELNIAGSIGAVDQAAEKLKKYTMEEIETIARRLRL